MPVSALTAVTTVFGVTAVGVFGVNVPTPSQVTAAPDVTEAPVVGTSAVMTRVWFVIVALMGVSETTTVLLVTGVIDLLSVVSEAAVPGVTEHAAPEVDPIGCVCAALANFALSFW